MTDDGIIFTKRGLGYFVCDEARDRVLEKERKDFIENEVPRFVKRMNLLGINKNDIL